MSHGLFNDILHCNLYMQHGFLKKIYAIILAYEFLKRDDEFSQLAFTAIIVFYLEFFTRDDEFLQLFFETSNSKPQAERTNSCIHTCTIVGFQDPHKYSNIQRDTRTHTIFFSPCNVINYVVSKCQKKKKKKPMQINFKFGSVVSHYPTLGFFHYFVKFGWLFGCVKSHVTS